MKNIVSQNPKSKYNNPCIKKAGNNEPLFVLRATDISSPKVILHWIAKNFETAPEEKLRDSFETAMEMRHYPKRKNAD